MWALLWIALTATNQMETYHIGNYEDKETCVSAMSKASVLVTAKGQTVDCIWINVNK
jgi:hypothetical protein